MHDREYGKTGQTVSEISLDLPVFDIEMATASGQQDVQNAAEIALAHIRTMPEWAPFLT